MGIAAVIRQLPEFASNVKSEMKSLFVDNTDKLLGEKQLYGVSLSTGYSLKHEQLLNHIRAEARMYLEEEDAVACKVASISMAGKNIFHLFTSEILQDAAHMSRSFMKKHVEDMVGGVEKSDFYMYCLASSMLSGCKYCMKFYTDGLMKMGVQQDVILEIVRVVAVLKAASHALELDGMRSYDFVARDSSMS